MSTKFQICCYIKPCRILRIFQSFGGNLSLLLQGSAITLYIPKDCVPRTHHRLHLPLYFHLPVLAVKGSIRHTTTTESPVVGNRSSENLTLLHILAIVFSLAHNSLLWNAKLQEEAGRSPPPPPTEQPYEQNTSVRLIMTLPIIRCISGGGDLPRRGGWVCKNLLGGEGG